MTSKRKPTLLRAGLALVLASSLTACQQQAHPGGEKPGGQKTEASTALPGTAWTRAERDQVADGGTLTLAVAQMPTNWNSDQSDGALVALTEIRNPMGYDRHIIAAEDGEFQFNPDYIVKAEVASEDPQVIKVQYNPKAVWEDGSPITIADMKAYAEARSGRNEAYQLVSLTGWEDIAEVKQTGDAFTGEIHFGKKFADWQPYIYPSMPASIAADVNAFNTGYTQKALPSAGPFKVASIDQRSGVITLDRNPKWWGEAPKLDKIVFKVTTEQNGPSAFANGELDALTNITTGDEHDTAKSRKDAVVQTTGGVTWTHLTINTERVSDVKVREAMAHAINRELIGQAVIGPLEVPVTLVDNLIFMPGQAGYEDSWGGQVTYDKKKAEKILADAGYKKGVDGVLAKDGKPLSYSITVPADTKSNSDRALQVQKDLNEIGFKIELKTVPVAEYFEQNVTPRNFDMVTFSWQGTLFPIESGPNLFRTGSAQNYTNWGDPGADKAGEQAQRTFDKQKRTGEANKYSSIVMNAFPIIPFYATPNQVAVKNTVVNYGASQFETIDWTKVGFKK